MELLLANKRLHYYTNQTMKISIMTSIEAQQKYLEKSHIHQKTYAAMYSSWLGGIITDPALMLIPVDDHLVHRGDGVFEAFKYINGCIYLQEQHINRLFNSAKKISLPIPVSRTELKEIISETVKVSGLNEAIVRLYVSRGPGTFGTNPYDSIGTQIYVIATTFRAMGDEKYRDGVKIGRSQIPPKESWLAQIKTCNYLPNVLMKKEAMVRHLDFTVSFDENNHVTESSTENIFILTKEGILKHPPFQNILNGTMMIRAFELAQKLVGQSILKIEIGDLSESDLLLAREVMMAGTTLDILPVVEYEGQKIGSGKPGPVAQELLKLLRADF